MRVVSPARLRVRPSCNVAEDFILGISHLILPDIIFVEVDAMDRFFCVAKIIATHQKIASRYVNHLRLNLRERKHLCFSPGVAACDNYTLSLTMMAAGDTRH